MLEKNTLIKCLEDNEYQSVGRAYKLALKMKVRLKRLRKYAKKGVKNAWFCDNFPRLEQCMKEDMTALIGLRNIQKSKGMPTMYSVFASYLDANIPVYENDVYCLFDICNNYKDGLSLEDGQSLALLFRCAIQDKICGCFFKCFREDICLDEKIAELFGLLDIMQGLLQDECIRSNPIEMQLKKDPARLYERLTDRTKCSYRNNLKVLAKKHGKTQLEMAEHIVNECLKSNKDDRHIGKYLCDKHYGGRAYLSLLLWLTIVFTASLCLLNPVFIISCIPVYKATDVLLDKIFTKYIIKPYTLPSIKLDEIPKESGVMAVITSLIDGSDNDERLFSSIERYYHSCSGENIYFGLLCDLCDSEEQLTDKDNRIIENACQNILRLRKAYGNKFFLFLRDRTYSVSEDKYIAHERKRGAVCSLCSFLSGGKDDFSFSSIKPQKEICQNIKFILTLDADTEPSFDSIRDMAGIMLHPNNIPCFDSQKGIVTKGYGILQPKMSTCIQSSMYSLFSKIMSGHGGLDNYSSGGINKNMSLYGKSWFCGKGMIEKSVFYEAMCKGNGFENGKVLSHDNPEGAVLTTAFSDDIVFTDSYPKNELSYYKRKHRWLRGDFQNMLFLLPCLKNESGGKKKNRLSGVSKYMIFDNIMSALLPIFTLALIVLSVFCKSKADEITLVTISVSVYILPFVNSLLLVPKLHLWQSLRRMIYSSGIYSGVWTSFSQMLFNISAIPKSAHVSLDALVRSAYRMLISHKKTLEWTTAAQNDAEKNDGLLGYIKKNLESAIVGAVLFLLSRNSFVKLICLLWFFFPVFCYHFSKHCKGEEKISKNDQKTIYRYMKPMWQFFEDYVTEQTGFLPPDNVSYLHDECGKVSAMTSPTNIGLYVLAVCCARKAGLVSTFEFEVRLLRTLQSVHKLPKYKGILYNWYDIFKGDAMEPMFVSSVDEGNYLACLICARGAVEEYEGEMKNSIKILDMLDSLIDVDIKPLYDKKRSLFYIGFTDNSDIPVYDRNRYDMLMSEARTLSMLAVAKKMVDKKHLSALSRPLVEGNRYVGLASWSGTAFEYFMPELFVESREGSLGYEAKRFSFSCGWQSGVMTKYGRVFGMSESLSNDRNENGDYKYFAYGTVKNALCVKKEERVISPYSAFLFAEMSPKKVINNLRRLKKLGVYGKYGFYESVDFDHLNDGESESVVKCFMSHHVGMSFAACTNLLFDGAVRTWFCSDKQIDSALTLFEEQIPFEAYVKKTSRRTYNLPKKQRCDLLASRLETGGCEQQEKTADKKGEKLDWDKTQPLLVGTRMSAYVGKGGGLVPVNKGESDCFCRCNVYIGGQNIMNKCGNCFEARDGVMIYENEYTGIRVYIPEKESVCVFLCDSKQKCMLEVMPKDREVSMDIGSGMCFFRHMCGVCFVYGFCRDKDGVCVGGADYSVANGQITAICEPLHEGQNVFCIGYADSFDEAVKLCRTVKEDERELYNSAVNFYNNTKIDYSLADDGVLELIRQNYVLPKDMSAKRAFTRTDEQMHALDILLVVYTKEKDAQSKIKKLCRLGLEGDEALCLLCIALCEYVRINKRYEFVDDAVCDTTLYHYFLSRLLEMCKQKNKSFLLVRAKECFIELCRKIGDDRTAIHLEGI